jgi:hypothetical protein
MTLAPPLWRGLMALRGDSANVASAVKSRLRFNLWASLGLAALLVYVVIGRVAPLGRPAATVLDYRLGPRYRYPNARASGGGREFELRELTSTAAGPGYGGNGSGSGAQRSAANQSSGV